MPLGQPYKILAPPLSSNVSNRMPNTIIDKLRGILIIAIIAHLCFFIIAITTGFSYVLGKPHPVLISGTWNLIGSVSIIFLCMGMASILIGNEYTVASIKNKYLLISLVLFIIAPIAQLIIILLEQNGIYIHEFNGILTNHSIQFTFLKKITSHINKLYAFVNILEFTGYFLIFWLVLVIKFFRERLEKYGIIIFCIILFIGSTVLFISSSNSYLLGKIEIHSGSIVYAINDPAKFNAILLTKTVWAITLLFSANWLFCLSLSLGEDSAESHQGSC